MSVTNADAANDALDTLQATTEAETAAFEELQEARDELETPVAPEPDDDVPATAAEADSGVGYAMTEARRVGSVAHTVDGHGTIRFGKPSGRAAMDLLSPIEAAEQSGGSIHDVSEYVWGTLAEWSLDEDHGAGFWADEAGLVDTIMLCRNVALGGNLQRP